MMLSEDTVQVDIDDKCSTGTLDHIHDNREKAVYHRKSQQEARAGSGHAGRQSVNIGGASSVGLSLT